VTEKKVDSFPRLEYFKRGRFEYLYENQQNGQAMLNFALQPTKEQAQKPKRYIWELDSSRDSGSVIHVSKFTFPEEVEKVKFGFLMLHAGGYDGAGSMTNVYDAFAEASKVLAPIAEVKFFACDCGRGKDWGKLCHTEGIHRWPDFRFIVDGESEDEFDGGNFETADFVNFVKSKLPSSKDEL